ncbi:atp synthase mitochondrial f1 complex assembly factor 2 [Plasmopara halstedii]|uniref:Atp synthase mitochondrial f1 complex assembly factor 2 n=1 Tax=Plasmopara halstedii TaxID=4781 RepID=A0A0P1B1N2_PLAHL|nr:atp synthase mitochondrial f1 complex assembly factor 2 [Plasmopara halstedii]CEG47665.1 atp synthase mitochondrial f1 complex assembly factor 2 [Plasmopara halstedii]|eukprot:XP_024584034.1 atp synthase mitochondrial f1 complex assembly factor 2 [Plasmopara halstedii]
MGNNSRAHLNLLIAASQRAFSAKAGCGGIAGPKITGVLRFYKDVDVKEIPEPTVEDGVEPRKLYAVTLDGKTIKTPRQQPVHLPTPAMAYSVAHEWDAQIHDIRPATMPIMTLASTALDLVYTSSSQETIDEMMHYLNTDTICYEVTADKQEKLVMLQQKKWKPIRKWFSDTFEGEVDVSYGSIDQLAHDQQLLTNVRAHLETVLHVIDIMKTVRTLTKECKSLITALAVFKRHITAKEAVDVSRLEEEFQISNWGLVEGGHDLDRVNCAMKVSSASFLLYLLENKH